MTVLQPAHGTAPGLVFMAPSSGPGQRGAMIFDDAGELVWFHPVAHKTVTDFKVELYHGKPVLTWWEGKVVHGLADGEWVVLDTSYRELSRFSAARGLHGDLHEFVITPQNTALVTSNEAKTWDLTSVGGSRGGQVVGGVVQELELPSGRLLWEWRSLDHVAVDETEIKQRPGPRFDYFHINSIDVAPDGNLIVSGRNTWAAYKIEPAHRPGSLAPRRQAQRLHVRQGRAVRVAARRARARARPRERLRQRGRAAGGAAIARAAARARHEADARLARARATRTGRTAVLSHFLGNTQLLGNGDVFVGWGGAPYVTEFTRSGAIAFDARLPHGGQSYRAFRFPWVGRPTDRPALAVRSRALYASWNGATEVASWQLLEGPSASELQNGPPCRPNGIRDDADARAADGQRSSRRARRHRRSTRSVGDARRVTALARRRERTFERCFVHRCSVRRQNELDR